RLPGTLREAAAEDRRIRSLLADLDSETFLRREVASKGLAELGAGAESAIRLGLADDPSAEARKRLEGLVPKMRGGPSPEVLRGLRAVEVLERIGTPEARHALEVMAGEAAGGWLMREARASLERLGKRAAASP